MSPNTENEISEPMLWWPNGFGNADLYNFRIELIEKGEVVDTDVKRIGLRELKLVREKDEYGESFCHEVNGVCIFAMGADYIPEDNILSRITEERTRKLLKTCADCNFNAIRIWGGGFYPDDFFFDICDEFGLLVFADMMFACMTVPGNHEMLENIEADIVVVATADHAHKDATVAALKAGFNVMCEKPMALRHEDCREMLMAEKESGKLLMVGQVCRFTPAFVRAKQIVESGILGDIFFAEGEYAHDYATIPGVDKWRMHPDREPILGGGCHSIDLLRWLIGDPVEVTAYSNRMVLKDWPISDATIGIMKWENGTIGKIFTSIGCKRDGMGAPDARFVRWPAGRRLGQHQS